ncbi:ErfK/YbiS/YcfS/YnhG family protein [Methylocella silvestris BL2]|uniref:ErfK/YbiS/YcfS/YnhG family protein n=1 Tax=Methylocella silvestris (strain DSM 15510 / CIP 108128 / LMG 27833 / NCIMB 13906 / BL2) TaxID=395965 RepID=B8ELV3_METSB|nr:L,D-transpeptidase [Methylocella silvestris]ACK50734.1 ErfK/YbiS/YcfS/YnhG family protein [Methylocella silvestris BL2]
MRRMIGVWALLCGSICAGAAQARVKIDVDLSSQTMRVNGDGADYVWPISTARSGYATPRGSYRAQRLERMHYSRKYHMSPMPHSIFFAGGYAIHGTYATGDLGRPASHGCVRLAPGNAALLFALVKGQGADIKIRGSAPVYAARRGEGGRHAQSRHDRAKVAEAYYSTRGFRAQRIMDSWMGHNEWDGWN